MTKLEEKIKEILEKCIVGLNAEVDVNNIMMEDIENTGTFKSYIIEIQSLLTQQSEFRDKIIEKQDEYIKFLSKNIGDNVGFLEAHGIKTSWEDVKRGAELRTEISELKSKSIGVKC